MLAALAGDGLIKSATLFLTRLLTLVSSVVAAAITAVNAAAKGGQTEPAANSGTTWIGFSQTQTAAIVIALLGLIAIVVAADILGRAKVTAASSDPIFLETPWECRLDRAPDVLGTLVALRAKDNKALFIPAGKTQSEWAPLSEVKGR